MRHCNIFVNKFLVTVSVRELARRIDGPVVLCGVMELYGCLQLFGIVFSSIKGSVDIIRILIAYCFRIIRKHRLFYLYSYFQNAQIKDKQIGPRKNFHLMNTLR